MAIEMIAVGRYYDAANRCEYPDGGRFTVATEAEADRLERRRKAKRAGSGAGEALEQSPATETDEAEDEEQDLEALRAEYERRAGKAPSESWTEEELRERIATYQHQHRRTRGHR